MTVELAFCSTTSININGRNEVLYDETLFSTFERKMTMANDTNNKIMQIFKKRQYFPLRVPLMFLMEYRGVGALVTLVDYIESREPMQLTEEDTFQKEIAAIMPPSKAYHYKPVIVDS
jgi:hypothetical protein